MKRNEIVSGLLNFLIVNRDCGLLKKEVFEIFWRFNGEDYECYSNKKVIEKVFSKMWNDKEVIKFLRNNKNLIHYR